MLSSSKLFVRSTESRAYDDTDMPALAGVKSPVSLVLLGEVVAIGEVLIIVLCAIIAKLIYVDQVFDAGQPLLPYAAVALVTAATAHFILRALELYEPSELMRPTISTSRILFGLLFSVLLLVSALFMLKVSDTYSRGWAASWLMLSMAAVLVERRMVRAYVRRLVAEGRVRQRIAVYGTEQTLPQAVEQLRQRCPEMSVVGAFVARGREDATASDVCSNLEELVRLGQRDQYDRIVVALPLDHSQVKLVTDRLSVLPVDVVLLSNLSPLPVRVCGFSRLGGLPGLKVQQAPLTERQLLAKSMLDAVLAAIALALLAPAFLAIAIAIKLDSKGPVFFQQRRHGYNHKVFRCVKFRTMTVLEDGEITQAKPNDDRVTRVGRILRKTSLDELPQLWNVLVGDMSLVGPRPHALAHNERYEQVWPDYANRHRVKPGLTGLAQVNGFRGETTEPRMMRRRMLLDLRYIEKWSLWLDLSILVKTVVTVVTGRNAH